MHPVPVNDSPGFNQVIEKRPLKHPRRPAARGKLPGFIYIFVSRFFLNIVKNQHSHSNSRLYRNSNGTSKKKKCFYHERLYFSLRVFPNCCRMKSIINEAKLWNASLYSVGMF